MPALNIKKGYRLSSKSSLSTTRNVPGWLAGWLTIQPCHDLPFPSPWKLLFNTAGFLSARSRIIWPNNPLAQLNQARVHIPAFQTLTLSCIRPSPSVDATSWPSIPLISSSSSLVMIPTTSDMGHAMPGPMWGPPVPLITGPWS